MRRRKESLRLLADGCHAKPDCITPYEGNTIIIKPGGTLEFDGTTADCRRAQPVSILLSQMVPWSSSSSGTGRKAERRAEDWEVGLCGAVSPALGSVRRWSGAFIISLDRNWLQV